jgi:hypothetical protein
MYAESNLRKPEKKLVLNAKPALGMIIIGCPVKNNGSAKHVALERPFGVVLLWKAPNYHSILGISQWL